MPKVTGASLDTSLALEYHHQPACRSKPAGREPSRYALTCPRIRAGLAVSSARGADRTWMTCVTWLSLADDLNRAVRGSSRIRASAETKAASNLPAGKVSAENRAFAPKPTTCNVWPASL